VQDSAAMREKRAFYAGAILGLAPLAHTHFFLVAAVYIGALFIAGMNRRNERETGAWMFLRFFFALAPAVIFAPWIVGKSGIIEVAGMWMQGNVLREHGIAAALSSGLRLWRDNALPWIFLTVCGIAIGRRFVPGAILLALFIAGNVLQFAAWNWDEIKIFIAIYLVSISVWQTMESRTSRLFHWWLVLLVVPALAEVSIFIKNYQRYTIYSPQEVTQAAEVRAATAPSAIIAAAPDHNSPITLTGRKLFYGYEGTLASHGLKFEDRQKIERNLERLKDCKGSGEPVCPEYLFWSEREKKYWARQDPGAGVERTGNPHLYRLP